MTQTCVEIGGIPQCLQIETESPRNPVLLLVHGGPGASTRFASDAWQGWKRHFTLVHWDQRGAGRTYIKNGPEHSAPMSFDRIVADGIEVATHLQSHLGQQKVLLLGHSWGSAVAVHMVKQRPDLFAAFIGTGLLVNFEQNERANLERELAQARQSGDQAAIAALDAIASLSYDNPDRVRILREWADKLSDGEGDTPYPRVKPPADFSAEDREAMGAGFAFSCTALFRDLCAVDLPSLGPDFEVPMFCLMGTHDQQTPIQLAERYFEGLNAPRKEFVRFEGCHHFVHMNRPDVFLDALLGLLPR